jgi:ATP synthase protein I
MSLVNAQLQQYTRRLLTLQVVFVAVAAAATLLRFGADIAGALIFGGSIAWVGTLILMWYGRRSERVGSNLARNASLIYGSAITRFFMTLALFAVGIAWLRLAPLPLFLGFVTGVAAQVFSTALVPGKKTWRQKR